MKLNKKILLAGAVAALVSFSANFTMSTAEAFDLGGIAKDIGKKVIKKSLGFDENSAENHQAQMIKNLSNAAICYASASVHVSEALDMNPEQRSQMKAALNNLQNNRTNMGSIKNVSETTKMSKEELDAAVEKAMAIEDKNQVDAISELIRQAKAERKAANFYKTLALRDAAKIIKSTAAAIGTGNLGDKLTVAENFLSVAKNAKSVSNVIGDNHKLMTNSLKTYEKKNNIAEVSDKDAAKQMKASGMIIE